MKYIKYFLSFLVLIFSVNLLVACSYIVSNPNDSTIDASNTSSVPDTTVETVEIIDSFGNTIQIEKDKLPNKEVLLAYGNYKDKSYSHDIGEPIEKNVF